MDDSKNQTGNARLLNMPGRRDQMLRTMLLCALTAAIFFLPFYIIDGGFFHYAGDFNSQQISFYRYMNGFIKGQATRTVWPARPVALSPGPPTWAAAR